MNIEYTVLDRRLGRDYPEPGQLTPGSAGIDLRAMINVDFLRLDPNEVMSIPTGIAIHIDDPEVAGLILPRSGLGHRHGIVLGNLTGLVDSDYQGEIKISCWNRSEIEYDIFVGDRIAQLIFVPIVNAKLKRVCKFSQNTGRGINGFGSTGL